MEKRLLLVSTLDERSVSGIAERRLLLGDPEVGTFEALLLLPPGPGPHAAIIGLHGHRERAREFAQVHLGYELARRGFVVLIPTIRAHDCSPIGTWISYELLRSNSTLLGLKVYEVLLLRKYLGSLEAVDSSRVGLLGHSGGSILASLAARAEEGFAAKVVDLPVMIRDRCGALGVHCQTVPQLVDLEAELNAENELAVPSLEVEYGFETPELRAKIEQFFEATLRPRANRPR